MNRFDARVRWPKLVATVATYLAGSGPSDDDLSDAADAIGDYLVWRATTDSDNPTTASLRRVISSAIADRS